MFTLIKNGKFLNRQKGWVEELNRECYLGALEVVQPHLDNPDAQFIICWWDWNYMYEVVPLSRIAAPIA